MGKETRTLGIEGIDELTNQTTFPTNYDPQKSPEPRRTYEEKDPLRYLDMSE